jgi:LmbE family N-acetylglucosaminyl deacetylase
MADAMGAMASEQGEDAAQAAKQAMVIAAHPDDLEFGCGGTIAKLARQGVEIRLVLLTSGDKGSHDPGVRPGQLATTREAEQRAAAEVLGIREVIFLRYADGVVENTLALRAQLAHLIRRHKPQIVFAIDPWKLYQLHPDHRAAGYAALDAIYAAREWNIFAEQLFGDEEPWRVSEVWLFWTDHADHYEDIGETVAIRVEALTKHVSQVGQRLDKLDENIRKRAQAVGEKANLAYAEEFKRIEF